LIEALDSVTRRAKTRGVTLSSALAAFALAVLLTSGCGGSSDADSEGYLASSSLGSRDIFVKDDFSDPASGWSSDDNDEVLLDYADGGYRILMKAPGRRDARLNLGTPDEPHAVEGVSVEADVTGRAGPYSGGQLDEFEFHGVACWGAHGLGYKFVLSPEGHYGILKDDDSLVILTEGDSDFVRYGATNRFRGDCTSSGGRPTLLVPYVDGKKIAQASDPDGPDRFPAIGLTAGTSDVGTDILFDNVLVRNPLARPPSSSGSFAANETRRTPIPLDRRVRSSSNLCKRKGIRYAGMTAQGGEVCFTVTRNYKRLLEVGFAFVPANRCPEMATGTFYVSGEAGPTVSREEIRSSGFTGTFRGTEATGVLQDWDICKEQTCAWRARRLP
jgi:hypothetical protein